LTRVSGQRYSQGPHQVFVDRIHGAIYNPGVGGIERSVDAGVTWSRVSSITAGTIIATPTMLYAGSSFPTLTACDPHLQHADRRVGAEWTGDPTPDGMSNGPYRCAVTYDGTNHIIITGNWLSGIWRYVEPAPYGPSRQAGAPPSGGPL
jgi:hypothetical protein